MERRKEIEIILKDLLAKVNDAINDNHYSTNIDEIVKSNRKVVKLSKEIEKYLEELDGLTE
jgi:Na+/phosphate symporter